MGVPYAEVIGDPIAHSKSPLIHKFWLEKLGLAGDYRATRVTADDLPAYLDSRRADPDWRGCNATMPLKGLLAPLLDGSFAAVTAAAAVNTVFRHEDKLVGNNTDLRGFAEPFRENFSERGSALIIGSGGAARAIFVALAALNFDPIRVMARSENPLLARVVSKGNYLPFNQRLPSADLVVNATPIGMVAGPSVDFDLGDLPRSTIVYDIVYQPLETPLLAQAKRRGLRTIDGLTMLIGQAAYAFMHFFEEQPPRHQDQELRNRLTQ